MVAKKIIGLIMILSFLMSLNINGIGQVDTAYVSKTIKPISWLGIPVVHANDIKGSLHQYTDTTDLENIPLNRLNNGFLVNLTNAYDDGNNIYKTYQYIGDGTTNDFFDDWNEVMLINPWRPNIYIEAGRLVFYNNEYYSCQASHTSNASFDSAEESNFLKIFPDIPDDDWEINGDDLYSIPDSTISIVNRKVGIGIKKDLNYELNLKGRFWMENNTKSIIIGDSAGFALGQSGVRNNVLIGSKAGKQNVLGSSNVVIGAANTFETNIFGTENIAIGSSVLTNFNGARNIAIGYNNLQNNVKDYNVAIGNNILINHVSYYSIGLGFEILTKNTDGLYNIGMGFLILSKNINGEQNIGIGSNILIENTTGVQNVAIGISNMLSSTTAWNNIAIGHQIFQFADMKENTGDKNVGIGNNILSNNTGARNIGIGTNILLSNSTGVSNIGVGNSVINSSTTALNNIAIGNNSLLTGNMVASVGDKNVAIGNNVLSKNTGANNVGIGTLSLTSNTTGKENIAIGFDALSNNIDGSYNIAIGFDVFSNSTSTSNNVAIGKLNMQNAASIDSNNVSIGYNVLSANRGRNNIGIGMNVLNTNGLGNTNIGVGFNILPANTSGVNNVGIGMRVLLGNTSGGNNIAIGDSVLFSNTTGASNIAIGKRALFSSVISSNSVAIGDSTLFKSSFTGTSNRSVAIGHRALENNIMGVENTAIGFQSLMSLSTNFSYNTAMGSYSFFNLLNGHYNIAIGRAAGAYYNDGTTSGNLEYSENSIYIGRNSRAKYGTAGSYTTNEIVIGYNAIGEGNSSFRLGNNAITLIKGQPNEITSGSDRRLKKNIESISLGLGFILKLQPVSYIRKNNLNEEKEFGFIAQDLRETLIQSGYKNHGMVSGKETETEFLGIRHADLIAILVKSVQEYKSELDTEKEKSKKLKQTLADLLIKMEKFKQQE